MEADVGNRGKGGGKLRIAIPLATVGVFWFLSPPEGVQAQGIHLLAIFLGMVVGIALRPAPMGTVAIWGLAAATVTGTLTVPQALSGFGNWVLWLIVLVFFLSSAVVRSGLGARIATSLLALVGGRPLGMAYGLLGTDFLLAFFVPSNTARAGSVLLPLVESLARGGRPLPGSGDDYRLGGFLAVTAFQGTVITSTLFITAMTANPLAVEMARGLGVEISWVTWTAAALIPGLCSLLLLPLLLSALYPPPLRDPEETGEWARARRQEMGPVSLTEWIVVGTLVLTLFLWMMSPVLDGSLVTAALLAVGILLATRILSWHDLVCHRPAWETLIWFSVLLTMAAHLDELGVVPWFSRTVGTWTGGGDWMGALMVLGLAYFFSHYFFASSTAHVSTLFVPFLAAALAAGTPPVLAALTLAFLGNLSSGITHYGTGAAPVLFGSGYVEVERWWKLGFIAGLANLGIWFGVGVLWWRILGLW